ncbi:uncharacterized protein LOC116337300 [Contarinia nasturtii]|uniref:uncharacterized protein LOC116337300 n=1 Tax=Contarinia nasturtii TaxID=265458 RepID=UPI0012D398A4|nr:uncharacterized protein LOC116337300 [Contarinia nasturtii]
MGTSSSSKIYNPKYSLIGCEKLYLNAQTADVYFNPKSEKDAIIPAHKNILSSNSSVFHDMFYGPSKIENNIIIIPTTAELFKEFLQFFYLSQVEITAENGPELMKLCNEYKLDLRWNQNILACHRVDRFTTSSSHYYLPATISDHYFYDCTVFSSNQKLFLETIHFSKLFSNGDFDDNPEPVTMKIIEHFSGNIDKGIAYRQEITFNASHETIIKLPRHIEIMPDIKYGILLEMKRTIKLLSSSKSYYNILSHKPKVEIDKDIFIEFHDSVVNYDRVLLIPLSITFDKKNGLVTQLQFTK